MRLRNIPRADDTLQAHFTVIKNPKEFRGNWTSVFGNDRPIRIEIGMGKGRFLLNMAKTYPNINFIGIERYSSVLLRAVEKFDTEEFSDLPNIRFVCMDARELPEVFAESEVISLRSAGVAPEAILAGVINAMARRSANFIARLSCEAPILFTGGVSHCQRFTHMLESHLGMPVQTHPDAQFAGAIGAAVIGQRQRKRA